jgi:hypothetical protein
MLTARGGDHQIKSGWGKKWEESKGVSRVYTYKVYTRCSKDREVTYMVLFSLAYLCSILL